MPLLARPDKFPRWATVPGLDALSGQPNVVEPPGAKMDSGWHYREKPPRNWQNWLSLKTHEWLGFVDEQKRTLGRDFSPNAFATLPAATSGPGLLITVTTAVERWLLGEKALQAASAPIAVPASTTSYLYLDSADSLYKVSSSLTVAGSPLNLLLAVMESSGVAVTSLRRIGQTASHNRVSVTVGPAGDADFTSLQEAIDHAGVLGLFANGASVEVVVVGQVPVFGPVNVRRPVRVRGLNLQSLITWTFTGGGVFQLQAGSEFSVFESIAFEYNGGAPDVTHAAILGVGAAIDFVRVEDCHFHSRCGVRISGTCNHWRVAGNNFDQPEATVQGGVIVNVGGAASDWLIAANRFNGQTAANASIAIDLLGPAPRAMIVDNPITGYNYGIRLAAASVRSIISVNRIVGTRTHGIECDGAGSSIIGNQLDNCGADASTQGGSIRIPTIAGLRCVITDNIVNDWQAGFAISNAAGQSIVSDNFCKQITGTATLPVISGGIAVQDDFCNVNGNYIDLLVSAASGTGGKRNCYGIKCGLFTSGPGVGFTANGADRSNIQGNIIKNLGGQAAGTGAVGIDVGALSNTHGNTISNIYGLCIRVDGRDGSVHGNEFMDYGVGLLAAPYGFAGAAIGIAPGGDRTLIYGNVGRGLNAGSTTCFPIIFETGVVDNFVRHNKIQAGSAVFQFPANLHLQDFGTWEWAETTTTDATVTALAPALAFAPNEAYFLATLVRARQNATSAVGYNLQAIISTDGAGVPTIRTQSTTSLEGDQGLNTAIYAVVGSTIVINVTGTVMQTWVWRASTTSEKKRLDNSFYL